MKDPTVVNLEDRARDDRERALRAAAAEAIYLDGDPNPSYGKGTK